MDALDLSLLNKQLCSCTTPAIVQRSPCRSFLHNLRASAVFVLIMSGRAIQGHFNTLQSRNAAVLPDAVPYKTASCNISAVTSKQSRAGTVSHQAGIMLQFSDLAALSLRAGRGHGPPHNAKSADRAR